jgi:LmbE family N-acetylglucosaminyl deacetylase
VAAGAVVAAAALAGCAGTPGAPAAAAKPKAAAGAQWIITNHRARPTATTTTTTAPATVLTASAAAVAPAARPATHPAIRPAVPTQAPRPKPSAVREAEVPACTRRSMNVVAHEDDDLLFINPAVSDDIAAGRCVATVFVTAGDAGLSRSYWQGREQGSMAAYAMAAGLPDVWNQDSPVVGGRRLTRYSLALGHVELFFLRLPDAHGNAAGRPVLGLQRLWLGELPTLHTLDTNSTYTRGSLISTLTALMTLERPDAIRTLDYAGRYGDGDHSDHHTVGYLTYAAQRSYRGTHTISGYMGYQLAGRPANLSDEVSDTKLKYFLAYAAHDHRVCQTEEICLGNFYGPRFTHNIVTANS